MRRCRRRRKIKFRRSEKDIPLSSGGGGNLGMEAKNKKVCGAEGPGFGPWCVDCIHQNKDYIGKRTSKEIQYDGKQCLFGYRWEENAPYPDDF